MGLLGGFCWKKTLIFHIFGVQKEGKLLFSNILRLCPVDVKLVLVTCLDSKLGAQVKYATCEEKL